MSFMGVMEASRLPRTRVLLVVLGVIFLRQLRTLRDPWCGDGQRLMGIFPCLFSFELRKDFKVNEHWRLINGVCGKTWSWHVPPRVNGLDDLSTLIARISDLPYNRGDRWVSSGDASVGLKTQNLVKDIEDQLLSDYVIGRR
ncbi:hypothetical protein Tco_1300408 [Tanacetum coccineum]